MIDADLLFEVLASEGIDADFVEGDSELLFACPLCSDHRNRLYVSLDTGQWICFNCDEQGSLLDFLQRGLGLGTHDSFELFRKMVKTSKPAGMGFSQISPVRSGVLPDSVQLPREFLPLNTEAPEAFRKYMLDRHVGLDLARELGVGYAVTGDYMGRVILPVVNGGHMYTYVARTILKRCPRCQLPLNDCACAFPYRKVLNADPSHPSLTLFNYDRVMASHAERAVLMEGWFDAARLPNEGLALLRSDISPEQLALLANLHDRGKKLIICLDGDDAGRKGTKKIMEYLTSAFLPAKVATVHEKTDPSSLDAFDLSDILSHAR